MNTNTQSQFFAKAFILFFIIGGLFQSLRSESYSAYRFDDFTAARQFGKVSTSYFSRAESQKEAFTIYAGGQGFSQKGGTEDKQASRHTNRIFASAEGRFLYDSKLGKGGITFSLIGDASSRTIVESQQKAKIDGEAVFSYELPYQKIRMGFEGGRGFQRLDAFGFLFTGNSNYAQIRFLIPNFSQATFIGLQFESVDPSLPRNYQTKSQRQIVGGDWNLFLFPFLLKNQFFGYKYLSPNSNIFAENQFLFLPQTEMNYFGWEVQSKPFLGNFQFDFFFSRQMGIITRKTNPYDEEKTSSSSFLTYASLQYLLETYSFALSGLRTPRHSIVVSDRKEDGFAFPHSQPRVLGGYSSFFLFQNFTGASSAPFPDLEERIKPNFNQNGLQLGGFQITKHWNSAWETDLLFNAATTSIGRGAEAIIRAKYMFQNEKSHALASICYARIENGEEFWRLYLSAIGSF